MKQTIKVEEMSCQHCKASVEEALTPLKGMKQVEVKLNDGEVEVFFDEELLSIESIKKHIRKIGYQVKEL